MDKSNTLNQIKTLAMTDKKPTQEQLAFRESILKKRGRPKKVVNEPEPILASDGDDKRKFVEDKMTYLKNCFYWLQEFIEGREDVERCKKTVFHLKNHCFEIQNKLNQQPPSKGIK